MTSLFLIAPCVEMSLIDEIEKGINIGIVLLKKKYLK